MVREVLQYLIGEDSRIVVDATVGSGGHASALLDAMGPTGRLIGLDRDARALERAQQTLARYGERVVLRQANFRSMADVVGPLQGGGVDGVLMDLGVSSEQLDRPDAGFSYRVDGPLSLAMEPGSRPDAADLLNSLAESELVRILDEYGDVRRAKALARSVTRRRPLATTFDLVRAAEAVGAGRPEELSRIFQALRIAVNDEFRSLEEGLTGLERIVRPGGRAVVISYHSGEDRIVKKFFTPVTLGKPLPWLPADDSAHRWSSLHRGAVKPAADEVAVNVRSRSARLRAAQRAGQ
jgi:16S rRNA (cytosine1402-N4)-methyltransferase